jgi:Cft2 family RNA processing exonuclease
LKIDFIGGTQEVGGSCIAIETANAKLALDYGIKVGEKGFRHFPKDFDATIISHAHLDHSGNLLNLSKGKPLIVGPEITREVTADLLADMVKIQQNNGTEFQYNIKDVQNIKKNWWVCERLALPGMQINLYPAGHVAGARMTHIKAEDKNILYTGDFCLHDTEILEGTKIAHLPKNPDALIIETTYGGKIRPERTKLINYLFKMIHDTIEKKGNVLIPVFAFHRIQEMSKRIDIAIEKGFLPKCNVYTISNLANKITNHFNNYKNSFTKEIRDQKRPFYYRNIKNIYRTKQIKKPAIVICTSGFGHAGASLKLLNDWCDNEKNSILISSGYLPPDSPLKSAKDKGVILENGREKSVTAEVKQIELSGHADKKDLMNLVKTLKPKKTFLVHGDLEQANSFSKDISDITEVHIPVKSDSFIM